MRTPTAILFWIWSMGVAYSQSFVAESDLPEIEQDGFYRIFISPSLAVGLNTTFSNVRIFGEDQKEVPYLFLADGSDEQVRTFREYEILSKKQEAGCCTIIELHNPERKPINNINLVIRNADVTKEAVLLGSDDGEQWFAIKENFLLYPVANATGTSEIKIVDFPLSNYAYYQLRVADSINAPLNILSAGYFETISASRKFTGISSPDTSRKDSVKTKRSYYRMSFDTARIIDNLEFSFTGAPYFMRNARLFRQRRKSLQNGRMEQSLELIRELQLTSKQPTTIAFDAMKEKELLLVVENDDNPPLEINSIKAYQLNRYFTAFLKKGVRYFVRIGNTDQPAPVYDISFFKDNIPATVPTLMAGDVRLLTGHTPEQPFTFFTTKLFVWGAIILVILILGYMSVGLLRDVRPGDNNKAR